MATTRLGITSKFYYESGNFGTPAWLEVNDMKDVSYDFAWDTADGPSRASRVKSEAKTQLDIGVKAMMKKTGTSACNAVITALLSPTANLDIMVLDGAKDVNGSRGIRYESIVKQGNEDQAIGNSLYLDLAFAPDMFSDNQFQSVLVTAGSPALTNL